MRRRSYPVKSSKSFLGIGLLIIVCCFSVSVLASLYGVAEQSDKGKSGGDTLRELVKGELTPEELMARLKRGGVDPIPCVGEWSIWGACSKTCGGGIKTRSWITERPAENDGSCEMGGEVETDDCNTQPCPVDCVGNWGDWGDCNKTCGGGTKSRTWNVTTTEKHGGTCEMRGKTETESCNTTPCPCEGEWRDNWDSCSKTCGSGTQSRTWFVTKDEETGGACANKGLKQERDCNTTPCPCEGEWRDSDWGSCSETCGGGRRQRTWFESDAGDVNGACPLRNAVETGECNTQACPAPAPPPPSVVNTVVSGASSGWNTVSSGASSAVNTVSGWFCDKRLKRNVTQIGTHKGYKVYVWEWNNIAMSTYGLKGADIGFITDELNDIYVDTDVYGYEYIKKGTPPDNVLNELKGITLPK